MQRSIFGFFSWMRPKCARYCVASFCGWRGKETTLTRSSQMVKAKATAAQTAGGRAPRVARRTTLQEVDPAEVDPLWRNKLWEALRAASLEDVKSALENGAGVSSQDPSGVYASPLHYAAAHGLGELVSLFLDEGANPRLLDVSGKCPADHARHRGHAQVAALLSGYSSLVPEEDGEESSASAASDAAYPFMALLPYEWRRMKEREDQYRTLFVTDREHADLRNPHLLLMNLSQQQPRLASSSSTVPMLFGELRPKSARAGDPCVVNRTIFMQHWDAFSEDLFGDDFPWGNVLCAGGAVLACALSLPDRMEGNKVKATTFYREESPFRGSDIDLFLYGLSPEEASAKAKRVMQHMQKRAKGSVVLVRSEHCITIVANHARHVQIILRCYKSPAEVLMGFDIDSCCVGFDGRHVYALPRAERALVHRLNLVDPSRQSKSYCLRLVKYAKRGFAVGVPGLDRRNVNATIFAQRPSELAGLAKLLVVESLVLQGSPVSVVGDCTCRREPARECSVKQHSRGSGTLEGRLCARHRALTTNIMGNSTIPSHCLIDIDNESELLEFEQEHGQSVDYSSTFLPCGPRWTPSRIRELLRTREIGLREQKAMVPFFQSVDADEIVEIPDKDVSIATRLDEAWLTENPGTQLTGSFHPTPDQDFWAGAFLAPVHKDLLVDEVSYRYQSGQPIGSVARCGQCRDVLDDPLKVRCCQKHICRKCIFRHLATTPACPFCRQAPLNQSELEAPDRSVLDYLNELQVCCPYAEQGCSWTNMRGLLVPHLSAECLHARIQCPLAPKGCKHVGPRGKMEHHLHHTCAVQQQRRDAQRATELLSAFHSVKPSAADLVRLCVGGVRFTTSRFTLCKYQGSLLQALADRLPATSQEEVFLDRPGEIFGHLLAWLQTGVVPASLSAEQQERLLAEAEFWRVSHALETSTGVIGPLPHHLPSQQQQQQQQVATSGGLLVSTHLVAANNPVEDALGAWDLGSHGWLFAIIDGHCGSLVSGFVKERLERLVRASLALEPSAPAALVKALRDCDAELLEFVRSLSDPQEQCTLAKQGACVVAVLYEPASATLTCASVGDCATVLSESGASFAQPISLWLHNAAEAREQYVVRQVWGLGVQDPDLFELVQDAKGSVTVYVKGVLQCTRVIGDFFLRHKDLMDLYNSQHQELERLKWICGPYVRCEPEANTVPTAGQDGFMIMASDGLWDYLDKDYACQLVRGHPDRQSAARFLVETALRKAANQKNLSLGQALLTPTGEKREVFDDVACIVVFFPSATKSE